jgi:hypothetical protein
VDKEVLKLVHKCQKKITYLLIKLRQPPNEVVLVGGEGKPGAVQRGRPHCGILRSKHRHLVDGHVGGGGVVVWRENSEDSHDG